MKKYMLLNMLIIFGVMQTGDLFCMHKLIRIFGSKSKRITRPNFCKSFRRYNTNDKDNGCWREIAEFFEEAPGFVGFFVFGVIGLLDLGSFFISDAIDNINQKINRFREKKAKSMCSNLEYVLQNKPCNIAKAKFIIISQPKIVKYVNESYCCLGVITRAIAENNKPMVNLFKENFVMDMHVLNKFVGQKNHEDPEGMAKLLIEWPNSGKVFASFNYNCDCENNEKGCEIIQAEAKRIRYNL